MRFDNPIYDHGFIFPDIADFPDVQNEYRNLSDDGVDDIRQSIKSKNLSGLELYSYIHFAQKGRHKQRKSIFF